MDSIRCSRLVLAFFSWPEYVFTTYHFALPRRDERAMGASSLPLPSLPDRTRQDPRLRYMRLRWPPRSELLQATMVVMVAVAIAAAYIGVWDLVWSGLVNLVRVG